MEQHKDQFQSSQQGTGSAENQGRNRSEQKMQSSSSGDEQRQDISTQIGESKDKVGDIRETGALSGRDDASGGSGDRMENTSSNQETDR
jgi:hypothetical protein